MPKIYSRGRRERRRRTRFGVDGIRELSANFLDGCVGLAAGVPLGPPFVFVQACPGLFVKGQKKKKILV